MLETATAQFTGDITKLWEALDDSTTGVCMTSAVLVLAVLCAAAAAANKQSPSQNQTAQVWPCLLMKLCGWWLTFLWDELGCTRPIPCKAPMQQLHSCCYPDCPLSCAQRLSLMLLSSCWLNVVSHACCRQPTSTAAAAFAVQHRTPHQPSAQLLGQAMVVIQYRLDKTNSTNTAMLAYRTRGEN